MAAQNGQLLGHEESNDHDKFQDKGCTPRANKRGNVHVVWASRNFRLGFFSKSKMLINFQSHEPRRRRGLGKFINILDFEKSYVAISPPVNCAHAVVGRIDEMLVKNSLQS
jgi:hypothetical protein